MRTASRRPIRSRSRSFHGASSPRWRSARFATDDFKRGGWQFPTAAGRAFLRETATREHAAGKIDDPANLADSRAWIFHGHIDDIVPSSTIHELTRFYQLMAVPAANINVVDGADAKHGMPIDALAPADQASTASLPNRRSSSSATTAPPSLCCRIFYPGATAPPAGAQGAGRIVAFDQGEFFDARDETQGRRRSGDRNVRRDCANDSAAAVKCRLHVVFRGCEQ